MESFSIIADRKRKIDDDLEQIEAERKKIDAERRILDEKKAKLDSDHEKIVRQNNLIRVTQHLPTEKKCAVFYSAILVREFSKTKSGVMTDEECVDIATKALAKTAREQYVEIVKSVKASFSAEPLAPPYSLEEIVTFENHLKCTIPPSLKSHLLNVSREIIVDDIVTPFIPTLERIKYHDVYVKAFKLNTWEKLNLDLYVIFDEDFELIVLYKNKVFEKKIADMPGFMKDTYFRDIRKEFKEALRIIVLNEDKAK